MQAVNNGTDAVYAVGLSRRTLEPVAMSPMWWFGSPPLRLSAVLLYCAVLLHRQV